MMAVAVVISAVVAVAAPVGLMVKMVLVAVVAVAVVLVVTVVAMLEVLLVVVVLATVIVRALVCAPAIIGTFVEALTVDMRVDVRIIVSNMVVASSMDALTGIILCVPATIGVGVLVVMGVNLFAMAGPLEGFRC